VKKLYFISATVVVLLFSSCAYVTSLYTDTSVTFTLPAWSQKIILDYWQIRWCCADGIKIKEIPPGTEKFSLMLPENLAAAVIVQPVTKNYAAFFRPAGCIYPENTVSTWTDGFAATILYRLLSADSGNLSARAYSFSRFNWTRFLAEIRQKEKESVARLEAAAENTVDETTVGQKTFYNPWNLNAEKILSEITAKTFTVYDLNLSAREICSIPVTELFSGINATDAVISTYLPENTIVKKYDIITLRKPTREPAVFLLFPDTFEILSVNKNGIVSLVRSELPI
jgi:hypothetical protein